MSNNLILSSRNCTKRTEEDILSIKKLFDSNPDLSGNSIFIKYL